MFFAVIEMNKNVFCAGMFDRVLQGFLRDAIKM